jgi:4-carboxymuconolactone decarboxylase
LSKSPKAPRTARKHRGSAGDATRRAVFGDAYVDQRKRATTPFDADFQAFITETAWASVWSRPGLTRRERSLITIALLAALGHEAELDLHVRATRNTGASMADVKEALLHVAIYAGIPAANSAFRVAKQAFGKSGAKA